MFLSPSRYREQLGRAQGLHPTSIPPKVEPRNKNEDPETVHRVAFKRNSCPSIDTGKPDREREPDGRKGKFVLLGSPLTSFWLKNFKFHFASFYFKQYSWRYFKILPSSNEASFELRKFQSLKATNDKIASFPDEIVIWKKI